MRETMTINLFGVDEEGFDYTEDIEVPAKWEICSHCRGNGTHVNPNIDGHGIGAEEWEQDWDDDSREMYFSGGYDVRCEEGCRDGKVQVVDFDSCNSELKKKVEMWEAQQENMARERAYDLATRRAEDGYRW